MLRFPVSQASAHSVLAHGDLTRLGRPLPTLEAGLAEQSFAGCLSECITAFDSRVHMLLEAKSR